MVYKIYYILYNNLNYILYEKTGPCVAPTLQDLLAVCTHVMYIIYYILYIIYYVYNVLYYIYNMTRGRWSAAARLNPRRRAAKKSARLKVRI